MLKRILATGLLCLSLLQTTMAQQVKPCEEGEACTLALYSEVSEKWQFINPSRAHQDFAPYSTFKIPNTLILLETGQINSADSYSIDLHRYPQQSWWFSSWREPAHKLKSAFDHSVLPLYQQWSADLGKTAYERYVAEFGYGNKDVSGPVDRFWLGDSLQISAVNQVEFLRKYKHRQLGLKDATYEEFAPVFLQRSGQNVRLYAKTGGGMLPEGGARGWYVGIVEDAAGSHYFAFNMDAENFSQLAKIRVEKALASLRAFNVSVPVMKD